jgi:hypothetical protein
MKSLAYSLCILLGATFLAYNNPAFAESETKKVCNEKTDKAGKKQQECKTIKTHKKLEATKVEDAKKK